MAPRRRYEHRTLPSGLRVLLVEDAEAQKASYAMAVEVGWGMGWDGYPVVNIGIL